MLSECGIGCSLVVRKPSYGTNCWSGAAPWACSGPAGSSAPTRPMCWPPSGGSTLELVAETLRAALNELAPVAPEWLQGVAPLEWYERYAKRIADTPLPREQDTREAYAQMVGEDGCRLLDALEAFSVKRRNFGC